MYVLGRMHGELKTESKGEVGEEQNWKRKLERKGVALVVAITHGGVNSRYVLVIKCSLRRNL